MTGLVHMATRAGEPTCPTDERVPRLTSDCRLVTCPACRESTCFNSALRWWLLKRLRAIRPTPEVAWAQ